MLLAEVSQFTSAIDSKFLFDNWKKYSGNVATEMGSPLVQILITIGNTAKKLSRIAIEDILGRFPHVHEVDLLVRVAVEVCHFLVR